MMELRSFDEGRFRIDGVEMPFQCIQMEVKQHENRLRPHYHDYIEVLYSLGTDVDLYINGSAHLFRTGDLAIINAKEEHDLYFGRAGGSYLVIKVLPQILYTGDQTVFEMKYLLPFILVNSRHQRVFHVDADNHDLIHGTLMSILGEWQRRDYGFELAIRADILRLFLWVLRYWQRHDIKALSTFDYSDDMIRLIQGATEYISENYADVTAKSVAAHCNLSYSYFSRTFKRIMGQSFSEYLSYVRIAKASQLLSTTDQSVAKIAEEVGFATPSYFIAQFKKHKQTSPLQYRRNVMG